MKAFSKSLVVLAAVTASLFLCACDGEDEGPALKTGEFCTIQFRRDALGAANPIPVPPMTDSFNGADTNVHGKLKKTTKDWVVIEHNNNGDMWIPKSVILLIKQ